MRYETATVLLAVFGLTSAAPTKMRREVPQEHSHNKILASVNAMLKVANPDGIADAVFGLLGNAAAAKGAGKITNLDCLHQAIADRAYTNAKVAGNVKLQVDSLIYAALERNTGAVGLKSVLCTDAAVNPEIQAITQHQDPAANNAAALNKANVLVLAKKIAAIGGNPLDALLSGTFAAGTIGDPTAAGHSCDIVDDPEGCIFTKNLLVKDATEAEIREAVAGIDKGNVASAGAATNETVATGKSTVATGKSTVATGKSACAAVAVDTATVAPVKAGAVTTEAAAGPNLQTFTEARGGPPPPGH